MEGKTNARERLRTSQVASLFEGYSGPGFSIRMWDGWRWELPADGSGTCTLVINSPDALASLVVNPNEVTLGQAFIHNDLNVEGDLFSVFPVVEYLMERPRSLRQKTVEALLSRAVDLRRWLKDGDIHSQNRDQASISHHYDFPVEFYRPWLGETLAYSCAYFRDPDDCLDQAQKQKLELICRKLGLREGERFLDIGCGWGSLVLHAASQHGVQAHGITLSPQQAETSQKRIREADLDQRCRAEHRDYRTCGELRSSFDKVASVGMFEHVGLKNLLRYFKTVHDVLKPGGAFLNHGIARSVSSPARASSFIDRYVFPDGKLVTLTEVITAAEAAGFEVRDVENLREHYELTLRRWINGLEQHREQLLGIVPESAYRIWLLYMAGSAAAFRRGDIAVHQVLLNRYDKGCASVPRLREKWYTNNN